MARWSAVLLLSLVAFAFFLRVWFGYDGVFPGDGIRLQGNDPWYHMRLVDSVIHQFPHRIGYDPYLRFPGGQEVDAAPVFDLLVALVVLAIGGSAPAPELVDAVAAFVPPVLGALIVVPVYFLGRRLFSRTAGLFAAALVGVFPGTLYLRSLLGYVDHHVAEVLLSTAAASLLVAAVSSPGRRGQFLAVGAGVVLAAYLATWRGGGLFVLVLVTATVAQLLRGPFRARRDDHLVGAVLTALLLALATVIALASSLPSVELHYAALTGGIAAIVAVWGVSRAADRWGRGPATASIASVAVAAALLAVGFLVFPGLVETLQQHLVRVFAMDGGVPVVEATSLLASGQPWPLVLLGEFTTATLLAPLAVVPVAVAAWRGAWADTLLLTWLAVMSAASLGQARYLYYLAVPVALLAGLACERILTWSGSRQEAVFLALAVLVLAPDVQLARLRAAVPSGPGDDWRESLVWLRDNSPEPFGDPSVYYERYAGLSSINPDPRLRSAYGVMSWWDPGYWIIRIGRRIPNTNPTQTNVVDAATFFLAEQEEAARAVLDKLGSRYVIVDSAMPVWQVAGSAVVSGQLQAMALTVGYPGGRLYDVYYQADAAGTLAPLLLYYPAYYRSMMSRLYAFGGREYVPRGATHVVRYTDRRRPDGTIEKTIDELRPFASYDEAAAFAASSAGTARIVGRDPLASCVPLARLQHLTLVHRSPNVDDAAQGRDPEAGPARVQIFEYRRTPAR